MRLYIKFRPLALADVPLMHQWFNLPHVQRFYSLRAWTAEEVLTKLKPYILGNTPVSGFIILINEEAVGYLQCYKVQDYPWPGQNLTDDVVNHAAGMDLFIGNKSMIGKGLGGRIIQKFLYSHIWPNFQYCLVDPDVTNTAALKCYKKLNFQEHTLIKTVDSLRQSVTLQLMILKKYPQLGVTRHRQQKLN